MGLLRKVLLAPLSLPMSGTLWLAEKIHEAADAEFSNPATIKQALRDLEADLIAGRITEDAFEEAEMALLLRLKAPA